MLVGTEFSGTMVLNKKRKSHLRKKKRVISQDLRTIFNHQLACPIPIGPSNEFYPE